ncbi:MULTISPECIES: tetratricopeptide repeat protein [Stenotrophomonas]|uniref:SIR2 family protein n=1 Tax=Stenotrophomonas lactitubi TaxID=2045214 RepID=A0AAW4GGC5_9GAMM|nr:MULTISPECIES: SIR2 family protein [Stenotrophomonas]MBM9913084.1 SIR2 family protein [Stenotrophomonas lactitubi]MBM9922898.1 SIR2 family protein [Stenotrophomonas lactitubi]MBM9940541.1 SIR2 family protein [Stenotrophomonas lactitubi]
MKPADMDVIRNKISPLLERGELALLLGAGFSVVNSGERGLLPNGDRLRDLILAEAGKRPGLRTSLKDAYLVGVRGILDFNGFLASCFTVSSAFRWQEQIFNYPWSRVYTTNIDNVLSVAHEQARRKGRLGGDFAFFNYSDPNLVSDTIGSIPVVAIHGMCDRLSDGFIFSSLEYAKATAKILDWHRDLAAKSLTGGLLVVGNQLEESDIDAYIASREIVYDPSERRYGNWIVMPNPDEIKAENYTAAGYTVIDATAQEFFDYLFSITKPKTVGEIVLETIPTVKAAANRAKAMTWFKGAFRPVITEIESARQEKGILRHFITGSDPEWFYIVNDAHASTVRDAVLTSKVADMLQANSSGLGIFHVTGPSGSGKTTSIRSILRNIVNTYQFCYEFDGSAGIDLDYFRDVVDGFTEKSVFVFYSASEYYYAVGYMSKHFSGKDRPYCLFILEDRTSDYRRNAAQLRVLSSPVVVDISDLERSDALAIAKKIEDSGHTFKNFSEYSLDRRASIILDKEKGYGGDLLSALFSLTTHENFEEKIYQDYNSVADPLATRVLDVVAIVNSLGFSVPISYVSGMLAESPADVEQRLHDDLAGVLVRKGEMIRCRHRIIASYYFDNCIAGHGSVEMMVDILSFLSRQFAVEDIRRHPLPYRIYKELISFEFLYDQYLPIKSRRDGAESVYHEAQSMFGRDGIFWLQFGRYYRKVGNFDSAIDCFRTGLEFYESFQTKHSLGVTLIEKYMDNECLDPSLYREGVQLLDSERIRRGAGDPYPTTALIDLLSKVVRANPGLLDARDKLKGCINYGLKYFSGDAYFADQVKRFVRGVDY